MITPYTPGPWRCVRTGRGEYYTHQIEVTAGHIASIVGWTQHSVVCPITVASTPSCSACRHSPS